MLEQLRGYIHILSISLMYCLWAELLQIKFSTRRYMLFDICEYFARYAGDCSTLYARLKVIKSYKLLIIIFNIIIYSRLLLLLSVFP